MYLATGVIFANGGDEKVHESVFKQKLISIWPAEKKT